VHVADTTCPTDYGGTTVPCTTSTTTPISTTLTISYSNGIITWRDCGYPGVAIGTTVQLFLDGQAVTIAGGAGAILSGGCTPTLSFPLCLSPGNFSAVAVDNGFPPEQATLVVTNSGSCANPQTGLGLHFGNVPPANKGPLAFTGTNILRLLLIALLALLLGLAITAANRRRRHAR